MATSPALSTAEVRGGSGLKDRHINPTAGIKPYKIDSAHRYMFDDFSCSPVLSNDAGAAAVVTSGETNHMWTGKQMVKIYNGAQQDLIAPVLELAGLEVSLDLTNNDTVEYVFGGANFTQADAPRLCGQVFLTGTDAFFAKLRFKQADVSGEDVCAFGLRGVEAFGVLADYNDYACLNNVSGTIKMETGIADTDTSTSTTMTVADGDTRTFAVFIDKSCNVRYEVDGKAPTTAQAAVLTSGIYMVPFFKILHDATTPGKIHFIEYECGLFESDVR